jgi:hypothetical protein
MNFLDRIGQLNIPNGLAGPPGAAGANGAGWTSGTGTPIGAPSASIKFYLDVANGQIFEWNGSNWASVVTSIFGTNGNVWFDGAGAPTSVPGAVANDYYLDTVTGNIYQYNGVTWGSPILTIKGTNGAPGANGTGLLGSVFNPTGVTVDNASKSFSNIATVVFNGLEAFPTVGSSVRSVMFIKTRFTIAGQQDAELYMRPRLVNLNNFTFIDLDPKAIDVDQTLDGNDRPLLPPSVVRDNWLFGYNSDGGQAYAKSQLAIPHIPRIIPSPTEYPYAYTKITTNLIRINSQNVVASVEYTSTTRYATYTAVYEPINAHSTFNLDFSASGGIQIELAGFGNHGGSTGVFVVQPTYHIVDKSIL